MKENYQIQAPAALPPGKESPVRTEYEAVRVPNSVWKLLGFEIGILRYNIRNQHDTTLAVSFISHCKITLHVSDAFCVHHQEY